MSTTDCEKDLEHIFTCVGRFEGWGKLETFHYTNKNLDYFSELFAFLHSVKNLALIDCSFSEVPKFIRMMKNLQILNLKQNKIQAIAEELCELHSLSFLDLSDNLLTELPKNIHLLVNLTKLYLEGNNFSESEKQRIELALPNCEIFF